MTLYCWETDRGERNTPLIISEYGILVPEDYGFSVEGVRGFMYDTFDCFLTAPDEASGYPPDGNQLVERWARPSLGDRRCPTGDLIDPRPGAHSLGLGLPAVHHCAGRSSQMEERALRFNFALYRDWKLTADG